MATDIRVIVPTARAADAIDVPSIYLPDSTGFIHWSVPVRAYPSIELNYKLTGYDWLNRALAWSFDTAPSGMAIDSDGIITWTPTSPADDGDHSVIVRMTRGGGGAITRSWTINVNTTNFMFVATTGNDTTGTGAIGAPYLTLDKAVGELVSGTGQTIYMRGGTHTDQMVDTQTSDPFSGKSFTEDDHVCVTSYPGESAIIDCELGSEKGMKWYEAHIVMDRLEVRNAGKFSEFQVAEDSVIKRCTGRGTDHPMNENPTGFTIEPGGVLDSCTAYDNYPTTVNSNVWNCSDFLFNSQEDIGKQAYVIDCVAGDYSLGADNSTVGFKVKRTDYQNAIHWHRCVAQNSYPFGAGIDYMSIRHSIGFSKDIGYRDTMGGAFAAMDEGMLFDHSAFISDTSAQNGEATIWIQAEFWWQNSAADSGLRWQDCEIVATSDRSGEGTGGCFTYGSPMTSSAVDAREYRLINNIFYAPSDSQLVQKGGTSPVYQDISEINAESRNSGNTYASVPGTISKSIAGGTWTWDRDAATLTKT